MILDSYKFEIGNNNNDQENLYFSIRFLIFTPLKI